MSLEDGFLLGFLGNSVFGACTLVFEVLYAKCIVMSFCNLVFCFLVFFGLNEALVPQALLWRACLGQLRFWFFCQVCGALNMLLCRVLLFHISVFLLSVKNSSYFEVDVSSWLVVKYFF